MATQQPTDVLNCFKEAPPPFDLVLPGMLAGTVGALISPGGAGKSMLALQLAVQIAGGPDVLGIGQLTTGQVAYLPAEDPEIAIHHRLHALGHHLTPLQQERVAESLLIQPLLADDPDLMTDETCNYLLRLAEDRRLLVLDTFRRFHGEDENNSGPMAKVISRMERIAKQTGCSIVFLHHSSKGAALAGAGDRQQASRGSSVLTDNIRWQAYLAGMSVDEAEKWGVDEDRRSFFVRFGVSKQNYGAPLQEQWLRRAEGGILVPAVLELKRKEKGVQRGEA